MPAVTYQQNSDSVSILSNSSGESRSVNVRSNIPAINTPDSEMDMDKEALIVISMKPLLSPLLKNVLKIMMRTNK